jgi:RNA polymerase sigma factor for flagellar operon FliA
LTTREPIPLEPESTAQVDPPEVLERFHATLDLVDVIAGQLRKAVAHAVEQDDLVASGREGLLDAARRYDPTRGVPFRLYANYRVRGAIIDGLRRSAPLPRATYQKLCALQASSAVSETELEYLTNPGSRPTDVAEAEELLSEHLSCMAMGAALSALGDRTIDEAAEALHGESPTPEDELARAEVIARVRTSLDGLSPEAAALVRRHYLEGERLEDIARDHNISKSWASRLLARATARLAERLKSLVEP